jgi:transcriptional regulator with GAF, ATPase, and Fis domain
MLKVRQSMNAEIVVLNGPAAGKRCVLIPGEPFDIGGGPASALEAAGATGRHCVVSREGDSYWLVHVATAGATLVNGARVTRCRLEHNDQIQVGRTLMVFQATPGYASLASAKPVLLQACVLGFLFRSLAEAAGEPHERDLERQIARVVAELLPCEAAWIITATNAKAAETACTGRHHDLTAHLAFVSAILTDGSQTHTAAHLAGVPVYARDAVNGAIVVRLRPEHFAQVSEWVEVLTAISTLAGMALENAREVDALRTAKQLLEERLEIDTDIVGNSPPVRRLLQLIERIAPRESTVLILGESGTGKELVARTLHRNSPRRNGPFVAINCAALTETLLESELFGHEKGSFTGATMMKRGKLEVAAGGTVFLDEIGEMAVTLQAKMLRVLEHREFERVGGTETRRLDIRLITATNRDLTAEVRAGRFREDLFHRLNVITLVSPPLRERREDILTLAHHFLAKAAVDCGRTVEGISPDAERLLVEYSWPGNVRELENAIERASVLGVGSTLLPEDLPETVLEGATPYSLGAYQTSVTDAKRESILAAYEQSGGDYKGAARMLGLHPNYLLRLVRNLNLRDVIKARTRSS